MRTFEYQLVTNQSMGADFTSSSQQLNQMALSCIQAVWTGGSAAGALSLQISNDNSNWTDYTGSSTTVSGAGNFVWNLGDVGYLYVRIKYVRSGGTGTLSATVAGKGP